MDRGPGTLFRLQYGIENSPITGKNRRGLVSFDSFQIVNQNNETIASLFQVPSGGKANTFLILTWNLLSGFRYLQLPPFGSNRSKLLDPAENTKRTEPRCGERPEYSGNTLLFPLPP